MTNLTEVSQFASGVTRLETTDLALGGPGGKANEQAQLLTNRTRFLKDSISDIAVNVKRDFGAVGDGSTDDSSAFEAAQVAAGINGVIYVPEGTYMLSRPFVVKASLVSNRRNGAIIKCHASFSGTHLLLSDGGMPFNEFRNMTFDMNFKNVHGYGSPGSVSLDQKGYASIFINCRFIGCGDGYYPIYSEATLSGEIGGTTASFYVMCEFIGNHNWLHLGNSEDDNYFQSCRFYHTYPNDTNWLFYIQGNNTKFVSCYFGFGEQTWLFAGQVFYMALGSYNLSFDQCHWEYGHASAYSIMIGLAPSTNVAFRAMRLNLVDCTNLRCLFLMALSSDSAGSFKTVVFENCEKYDVRNYSVLGINTDATMSGDNSSFVEFSFAGLDQFLPTKLYDLSGASITRKYFDPVKLHGAHRGIHYAPREPGSWYVNSASPAFFAVQLKRKGYGFLSVNAYFGGHNPAEVISALFYVYWDGTNTGIVGQIGTTQYNGALGASTLILAPPDAAGTIIGYVTWTTGAVTAKDVCVDSSVVLPNEIYGP